MLWCEEILMGRRAIESVSRGEITNVQPGYSSIINDVLIVVSKIDSIKIPFRCLLDYITVVVDIHACSIKVLFVVIVVSFPYQSLQVCFCE